MKQSATFGFFFPNGYNNKQWKIPLNLSIGLHVLVLLAALVAPSLYQRRLHLPEFYTVNLINVTELPKQSMSQENKIPPVKTEKEITPESLLQQTQSISPSLPVKVISLQPVKRKSKRSKDTSTLNIEKMKLDRELERLKAEQELKKSKEAAALAAKDAITKLRQSLQKNVSVSTTPVNEKPTNEPSGGPLGEGSVEMDDVMKRFYAGVYHRIQEHWILPPLQNWDNSLEAILVVRIQKDGIITKHYFEKTSENIYFNQFVMKTVREAAPLPSFPKELKKSEIEIGLRFTPAGVI